MTKEELINAALDFVEEEWQPFINKCEEMGYSEDEVNEAMDEWESKKC